MRSFLNALIVCCFAITATATTIGQIETFTTGTDNWTVGDPGNPNPPTTALGGPGGAADQYLQLQANGVTGTPGSRLVVFNQTQWTGSFSGIIGIVMDVKNFGPNNVDLRLLFEHMPVPGPPQDLAMSLNPVIVPAGSGWVHVLFPINPASLFVLIGTAAGALSDVTTMRIFHNPVPGFGGPGNGPPAIQVTVGVDNIQAVPEPVALALVGGGLIAIGLLRRRARRS
jgi:hypothetical protein